MKRAAFFALMAMGAQLGAVAAAPPPIRQLDAFELAGLIDREVEQKLNASGLPASPRTDDAEFLRRVYLDLHGVIPSAKQAVAFLDNPDPDKRRKLVDELLANPEYGRHFAEVWEQLLLPQKIEVGGNRNTGPLNRWLEQSFKANKPWSKIAYELLTASGAADSNGAVAFLKPGSPLLKVTDATDTVAANFLGVQVACAQCHDHPFAEWKRRDYWGLAMFFTRLSTRTEVKGGITEEPRVSKKLKLPDYAADMSPSFLGGQKPALAVDAPYRPVLAAWITSAENPYFARAMVNRTWAHFFGRGLVNPVDNLHSKSEASHPRLFEVLSEQFVAHDFDVQFLIRAITGSQTYQRTSRPEKSNAADQVLYSHMAIRVLNPVQLHDSYAVALTGQVPERSGGRFDKRNKGANGNRSELTRFLETEDEAKPTEYRRGIPHLLRLMNATPFVGGNGERSPLIEQLLEKRMAPTDVVDGLYLATLSRRPETAERERMLQLVQRHGDNARTAYADILWVLLNSSEFALNH